MWMTDILSQYRVAGLRDDTPSSSNSLTIQVTSEAAYDMALYSASEDDLETVPCFLLFQLIGELPKRIR